MYFFLRMVLKNVRVVDNEIAFANTSLVCSNKVETFSECFGVIVATWSSHVLSIFGG